MLIKLEKDVKENLNFVSSYYRDPYWIDKQIPNIIAFEKFKIKNGLDERFRRNSVSEKIYISFMGKPSEELLEQREMFLLNQWKNSKTVKFDKKHLERFLKKNNIKLSEVHYDKYMKRIMKKVKNDRKRKSDKSNKRK